MIRSLLAAALMSAAFAFVPLDTPSASAQEVPCRMDGCCPTYDPNVDCWAEGHWHYNHCKNACT